MTIGPLARMGCQGDAKPGARLQAMRWWRDWRTPFECGGRRRGIIDAETCRLWLMRWSHACRSIDRHCRPCARVRARQWDGVLLRRPRLAVVPSLADQADDRLCHLPGAEGGGNQA